MVLALHQPSLTAAADDTAAAVDNADERQVVSRIVFGSCIRQDRPAPIFDAVRRAKPQLLLMLGDNIYADTSDVDEMRRKYAVLADHPDFSEVRGDLPILATWDDHDFGRNDGGAEFSIREQAEQAFLDFWNVAEDAPRRRRDGVYHARRFGPPGKRLQVILLDTRYFRSPLARGEKRVGGPYRPSRDPEKTMLGEAQWRWLEEQLRLPADVRVIASSIQCIAEAAGQETWSNLPHERERLFELISSTGAGGVLLVSGDRHWAELSMAKQGLPYPLWDMTSSSFNQKHPRGTPTDNRFRASDNTYHEENFGLINIDWQADDPLIALEVRDLRNSPQIRKQIRLSELQP